jgi:hypothetical protein
MSLFKTPTEFRRYVPAIDENINFANLQPSIDEAEDLFIKDLLGETFYDILLADYTDHTNDEGENLAAPNNMNADNLVLLPYVQRCLANYAALLSLDQAGASVGNIGVQEGFGSESRPVPRWKLRRLEEKFINSGDRFADKLLAFLEKEASPTKYNAWYSDMNANTAMQGFIVYSTKIASQYIDINESRRVFLRLKKRIREIEQAEVKRMLCTEQYDVLVTQIQTGTLSPANERLIAVLEPYIAKKALWLSIPSLKLRITDEGISIITANDGAVSQQSAGKDEIKSLMCSLKDGEHGFDGDKNKIDQFIIDNIADYPLIEESECYTSKETTPPKYQPDNDSCNKHFSV